MSSYFEPADALSEERIAKQAHGARHQPSPPPRLGDQVGELVILACSARRNHVTDGNVMTRLRDAKVEPVTCAPALTRGAQKRVEIGVLRARGHVQPTLD